MRERKGFLNGIEVNCFHSFHLANFRIQFTHLFCHFRVLCFGTNKSYHISLCGVVCLRFLHCIEKSVCDKVYKFSICHMAYVCTCVCLSVCSFISFFIPLIHCFVIFIFINLSANQPPTSFIYTPQQLTCDLYVYTQ